MKSLSIKKISIIIPVYNAASLITKTIGLVRSQKPADIEMEVLVIDDRSTDMTSKLAKSAGAKVIPVTGPCGNPARARNIGAKNATGDILIFLDVDCHPEKGWLSALLKMHAQGYLCVAGGLSMPENLSLFARLDYYCGWYHVHPHRTAGTVLNCPPCNISIDRSLFLRTSGFTEQQPIAYSHEELCWQEELRLQEIPIYFEPQAAAAHWNRDGFGNLLRRNYRWAYGVIESKANNRTVRMAWLYQFPWMAILLALPLVPIQTFYIITCWLRAGIWEPLFLMPLVLAARTAYGFGMSIGGIQWICSRNKKTFKQRFPRWI
jgi:mycofactocin glycosyltransferase